MTTPPDGQLPVSRDDLVLLALALEELLALLPSGHDQRLNAALLLLRVQELRSELS